MAKKITSNAIVQNDIFKGIGDSAEKSSLKVEALKEAINEINKELGTIKKTASSMKKGLVQIDASQVQKQKELNQSVKEANNLIQQNTRLNKAKQVAQQALTIEQAKYKEELRKANLEAKQVARLQAAQEGSVEKLRARLAILNREYDKLSKNERETTKRGARLKKGIDQTTVAVTKLEQATGRHQRNVGNYASALDGLNNKFSKITSVAGQFGLALGGFALVRSGVQTIKEYTQSIADLQAITGASGADLQFYKDQAVDLGKKVEGGATAVVEAYKLIGSAKPELLNNARALDAVTQSAITLSKASGLDLPEAATRLTDAMNQFGAPAEEAGRFIDVLANGAKFGSAEIPQVTDALLKFGAVAKTSNVSIEESTALIEALAEKGLKGAEAGTGLRNVMLKLSAPDALPKEAKDMLDKLGISFEKLQDTSLPFSERLKELKPLLNDNTALVKTFGTENAVVATNLLTNIDRVDELTVSMETLGTAQEQADIRSKTLGEAFSNIGRAWDSMILSLVNGEGSMDGVIEWLDWIAENLPTIIGYVVELGKVLLIYKARLIAINLAQKAFGTESGKMNVSLKQLSENLKKNEGGLKGFGSALSGIGWATAIAMAYELAQSFIDIANGTAQARVQMMKYEQGTKRGSKAVDDYRKGVKETVELLKSQGQSQEDITKFIQKTTKATIDLKYEELARAKEIKKNAQEMIDQTKGDWLNNEAYAKRTKTVREATAWEAKLKEEIRGLKEVYREVGTDLEIYNEEQANEIELARASASANKDKAKSYKDASEQLDLLNKRLEAQQAIEQEALDFAIGDKSNQVDEAIQSAVEVAEKTGQVNSDLVNRLLDDEYNLREERAKSNFLRAVDEAETVEEVILAEDRLQRELSEIQDDINSRRLGAYDELNDAQEGYSDKLVNDEKEKAKKLEEIDKESAKRRMEIAKLFADYLIEQSNKKIELLDKEIAHAESQTEKFQELADQGNINAQQSIAEEQKMINEANKQKAEEQKKQELIKLEESAYSAYQANVENGSESPLADTIRDISLLQAFINSLGSFDVGTEFLDVNGKGVDGKGGQVIVAHHGERIMTEAQNAPLMALGLTNDEVVKRVQMSFINEKKQAIDGMTLVGFENTELVAGLNGLKSEIRDVKNAIESAPEYQWQLGEVMRDHFEFTESRKKGNTTRLNRFRS